VPFIKRASFLIVTMVPSSNWSTTLPRHAASPNDNATDIFTIFPQGFQDSVHVYMITDTGLSFVEISGALEIGGEK
jgi:hypothetical protein